MLKAVTGVLAVAGLITLSFAPTAVDARDGHRHHHHNNNHHRHHSHSDRSKAAVAAAAVIGLAAAAAAAENRHDDYDYDDGPQFDDRPKLWFPKPGITCYRKLRACYKVGHGYNARWTRHEFY